MRWMRVGCEAGAARHHSLDLFQPQITKMNADKMDDDVETFVSVSYPVFDLRSSCSSVV